MSAGGESKGSSGSGGGGESKNTNKNRRGMQQAEDPWGRELLPRLSDGRFNPFGYAGWPGEHARYRYLDTARPKKEEVKKEETAETVMIDRLLGWVPVIKMLH